MTILNSGTNRLARRPSSTRGVPDATVARLPLYVRALGHLLDQGLATCSSESLAFEAGVTSAQVRKDLSHLGTYGTRGVGYDVAFLRDQISFELGQTTAWDVLIVGAGHLGQALGAYQGFGARGLRVVAVVDSDATLVGSRVGEVTVQSFDDIAMIVARTGVQIAIIATPTAAAQSVADRLVAAGISSILNFAPVTIAVPSDAVNVRQVDVATELKILAFHEQRRAATPREAIS